MLCLSRTDKPGDNTLVLTIGEDLKMEIHVIEARKGKVRLGFDVPPQVNVRRGELEDRRPA